MENLLKKMILLYLKTFRRWDRSAKQDDEHTKHVVTWYGMVYLLTAIGLSPGGSTHLHTNNKQNNTNNNQTTQITTNVEECGPCPVFASFTLAFALQLRKKHGKTSDKVRKPSVRVQYTYYQNTHTLQNLHKHTHTHTHIHITKQYKTTTVQIKTNTLQDIPKWNSHNIIKCPQYKVTLMYIAPLPTRNITCTVILTMTPWRLVEVYQRFRETCSLDNEDRRGYSFSEYSVKFYQTARRHNPADQWLSTAVPSVSQGSK
jgi:hypothetical protein